MHTHHETMARPPQTAMPTLKKTSPWPITTSHDVAFELETGGDAGDAGGKESGDTTDSVEARRSKPSGEGRVGSLSLQLAVGRTPKQ